jgi:GNAT superfamily N-acetyltransferase
VSDLRHGQGIGRDLLIDAVKTAALAGANAAARFIAVDPIDQAARTFYGRFGFRGVDGDPGGRLFIRVDEALALLEHQQSS